MSTASFWDKPITGKIMNVLKVLLLTLFVIFISEAHANEVTSSHATTVEQFVKSFNAQNSKAMATFVTENVQWLSVDGENILLEVQGKDNLIQSMNDYFKSCPTCRSEVSNIIVTKNRISAIEMASWQGANGVKSQRALSVYEFIGDKINRVYYFPAEK